MDERKWRTSAIFWCFIVFLGGMTFIYNLAEVKTLAISGGFLLNHPSSIIKEISSFIPEQSIKGYLIKTPGCTVPDMKPMDPSVRKFIFRENPVVCNNGLPALFESNRTSIYLLPDSMKQYNITNAGKLKCCFQYFRRRDPLTDETDKKIIYNNTCYNITQSADVDQDEEYVRIKCQYNSRDIYKDFFNYVPIKNDTTDSYLTNNNENKLNLLVIGIDAVSRLNFHRQMPKTAFYLDKLNAIEMLGYNKIGDNTFPNLIAALTGKTEKELERSCWPKSNSYFDDCDFVWKHYKRAGYTTAFGEDSSWMGMFLYNKRGFRKQPTDYFYDHFDLTSTNEIGNNHRMNVDQCVGSRQVHEVFLNYVEAFSNLMHENLKSFFGFFWSASLSHDFLNKPKLGDQTYLNLLFNLDEEGVLNNTALIVMSDHGIRWGEIRSTYQGRMEERLPFLYIILPQWYRNENSRVYNNLRTNAQRLTTPFDLHETFLDILKLKDYSQDYSSASRKSSRGISLFQAISKNRTCHDAGIDTHWCTCQKSVKISLDTEDIRQAVNSTISYINKLLVGYADCYELKLDKIIDARELTNDNEMKKYKKSIQDYTVSFRTTPGGAIFEATVRKELVDNKERFSVTGTVSRINLYGSQSKCITEFHLKLYCYCRSYLGN